MGNEHRGEGEERRQETEMQTWPESYGAGGGGGKSRVNLAGWSRKPGWSEQGDGEIVLPAGGEERGRQINTLSDGDAAGHSVAAAPGTWVAVPMLGA